MLSSPAASQLTGSQLLSALVEFFIPKETEDKLRHNLENLKQTGRLDGFYAAFQNIILQMPFLSENDKVWHFKRKLKPELFKYVNERNPASLGEAYGFACMAQEIVDQNRFHEDLFTKARSKSTRIPSYPNTSAVPQVVPPTVYGSASREGPVPMDLGNRNSVNQDSPQSVVRNTPRLLTKEQLAKFRKEGICFNCQKKGHIAKSCPDFRID